MKDRDITPPPPPHSVLFRVRICMGVDPGGMGGYIPPPNISGGGMVCTIIPPPPNNSPSKKKFKKMKRQIKDESPMGVVNGYYSQDDH